MIFDSLVPGSHCCWCVMSWLLISAFGDGDGVGERRYFPFCFVFLLVNGHTNAKRNESKERMKMHTANMFALS